MTPLLFLGICVAGGVGAMLRFCVDTAVVRRLGTHYPWATTIINVSGSFVLGLVTGLAVAAVLPEQLRLVLGVGVLGGYTTFSTASVETVRLARTGRLAAALTNGLGMLLGAVLAAALGYWIGSHWIGSR